MSKAGGFERGPAQSKKASIPTQRKKCRSTPMPLPGSQRDCPCQSPPSAQTGLRHIGASFTGRAYRHGDIFAPRHATPRRIAHAATPVPSRMQWGRAQGSASHAMPGRLGTKPRPARGSDRPAASRPAFIQARRPACAPGSTPARVRPPPSATGESGPRPSPGLAVMCLPQRLALRHSRDLAIARSAPFQPPTQRSSEALRWERIADWAASGSRASSAR